MRPEQFEQLTAYLDDELTAAERQEVEELLERDVEARQLLDELRQASQLVAALPRGKAPAAMSASVMARLERQALLGEQEASRPRQLRSMGWTRLLGVAAGTVMMLTAGWLMVKHSQLAARPSVQVAVAEKRDGGTERGVPGDHAVLPQAMSPARARSSPVDASAGRAAYHEDSRGKEPADERVASAKPAASEEGQNLLAMGKEGPGIGKAVAPAEAESAEQQLRSGMSVAGEASIKDESNADLLKDAGGDYAQYSPLSNRLELVVDVETRDRLVAEVEQFAHSNGIPDLRSAKVTAPIQPEQAYYYVEPETTGKVGAPEAKSRPEEAVEVVMNVQAPQAVRLIEAMQKVAREHRAQIGWTANSVQVSDAEAPAEVMRQLVTYNQVVLAERRAPAAPAVAKAVPEGAQEGVRGGEMRATQGKGARTSEAGARTAGAGGPRSKGGGERGRESRDVKNVGGGKGGQQLPATEDYITLGISFRLQPSSIKLGAPAKSGPASIPAAPQPTSAPVQTQPAPRGGAR